MTTGNANGGREGGTREPRTMEALVQNESEPREIASGVWWLPLCLEAKIRGASVHLHNAQYLIVGSEKTLLFDAGFPAQWPSVERALDKILDGRDLDYVVPSHPEVNHCFGVLPLFSKYPGVTLVGNVKDYPLFWPEHADRMVHHPVGSELDLGSHRFRFVEAIIKDLPSTQWGYEASQQIMFAADGFAYTHMQPLDDDDRAPHRPGECRLVASELPTEPGDDQIVWITKLALFWTRYVKMDMFVERYRRLVADCPTRLVAPAHGAVIDDMDLLERVWDGLARAYSPGKKA